MSLPPIGGFDDLSGTGCARAATQLGEKGFLTMIHSIGARLSPRCLATAAAMLAATVMLDAATSTSQAQTASDALVVEFPAVDPALGRELFVTKGCVICHSINGVGGLAAPPLEAEGRSSTVDVAGFAARMWLGAGPMVWLQTLEMGYQIDLTGEDIANLAGFVEDVREQARFTEDTLPDYVREALLTDLYRRPEDWLWEPEAP